jgi:hypothetical protein
MSNFFGIGVNILSSGIAFVLGVSLRSIIHRYRVRHSRGFWGSKIGKGKTVIFLGSFPNELFASPTQVNEDFEPTGLVGLGDARAVHELTTYLSSIGVSADMAYTSDKAAGQVKNNIVLLGAEEANHLVKGPFHDIPSTLRFETSSPMTLYDTLSGEPYRAEWEGKEIITDYGKLVRARNPYAPEYALVMICGIYGYGTWAACGCSAISSSSSAVPSLARRQEQAMYSSWSAFIRSRCTRASRLLQFRWIFARWRRRRQYDWLLSQALAVVSRAPDFTGRESMTADSCSGGLTDT